jgi:hypothetical protein
MDVVIPRAMCQKSAAREKFPLTSSPVCWSLRLLHFRLLSQPQQPQQKEAHGEKFLVATIAVQLGKQPDLLIKTANLDDEEQGLSDAMLNATDVLVS